MAGEGETLGKNIRQGELEKIPYLLVIGDREMEKNSVNARERHVKETKDYSVEEFVRKISEAIKSRK